MMEYWNTGTLGDQNWNDGILEYWAKRPDFNFRTHDFVILFFRSFFIPLFQTP